MKYYILYNPISGRGKGEEEARRLGATFTEVEVCYYDLTQIEDYAAFFAGIPEDAKIVLCGGDGTLNRFVNNTDGIEIAQELLYFASGSGNDFLRDVKSGEEELIPLNGYIKDLPVVTVQGKTYRFINGVGYGIDGYCCEVGDELRKKTKKPINYAGIAIKGLLFHYKPTDATVIVDGKEYTFKKVWIAPTMLGRYYGGGMMPCPEQRREHDTLSVLAFHDTGKLQTLMIFPSLFKGEHVKKVKKVTVLSGKVITVRFAQPRTVQIDGETVFNVTEYTARR